MAIAKAGNDTHNDGDPKNMNDNQNALPQERITTTLAEHALAIADSCGAAAILVYEDALDEQRFRLDNQTGRKVFYVSKTPPEKVDAERDQEHTFIRVPNVNLTRFGQIKIAGFLALNQGLVREGDVLVCLTGQPASGTLDTLVITEVSRESDLFSSQGEPTQLPADTLPQVVERVIDLSVELGTEGREGKPVGAMFVVGDTERVICLTRQLIMNPFKGYSDQERNILDENLEETLKEFSAIDGAYVIQGNGIVATCGAYLKTSFQDEADFSLPQGLGARHHAAAGITAVTDAIAVTVSESTGTVTVFRNGRIVTEIEKPRNPRARN